MGKILVVAHYHLRPGGVRRVIETALPRIAGAGRMDRVVLAVGEAADTSWISQLRSSLSGTPLEIRIHPEFLYWSEQKPTADSLQKICAGVLQECGGAEAVLWAHNLGLGRNIPLALAWAEAVRTNGSILISHHHDFFFDNRWSRWSEMLASGISSLEDAARAVFPVGKNIVHVAINRSDLECLSEGFGAGAVWIPNSVAPVQHSAPEEKSVPAWVASRTGSRAPYWLFPCRLMRRKNIAEAVLLARWLSPEAHVITTGAMTSLDELGYSERLAAASKRNGWNLDLSILDGVADHPPISALIARAEAVLLTSLQEGFGLPYLEAAAGGRPLLARSLSNVMPDLVSMGLHAPLSYEEVYVPLDAFDSRAEMSRQRRLSDLWRSTLPAEAVEFCDEPVFLRRPGEVVPFSRLTFSAQEEVLSRPPAEWDSILSCVNPDLAALRGLAGGLPPASLNESAQETFSPARFGENFHATVLLANTLAPALEAAPVRSLRAFLRDRLATPNLYPLLLSTEW